MAISRDEVRFEIVERLGVIANYPTGWTKEVNLVSWNGGKTKIDIRDWDDSHEHMSRGITLSEKEMNKLIDAVSAKSKEIKEVFKKGDIKKNDKDFER